jgi:hypothetical protein
LFHLLAVDESLLRLSTAYQKLKPQSTPSQETMTAIDFKLWNMDVLVWNAISRILQSCQNDLPNVGLPNAYANRLERFYSNIAG